MSDASTDTIKQTTAPVWKKVLWWVVGITAIGTLVTVLIVALVKQNKINGAVNTIIDFTQNQLSKADVDAKIKVAQAASTEKEVVDKLKEIKALPDADQRNKALADLL